MFEPSALFFGDVYHVASHHTDDGDGATGLVLRRGYFTIDGTATKRWYGRARIEVNQSGEFETYDFEAGFKDLFVGLKAGRHRVLLGLSATPTFDLIESIWGLRYLVRTPMDLQGVASRDTGISVNGPLNDAGTMSYRFMAGAGSDFGNESGDGEKWMGAVTFRPSRDWVVDLYLDYEKRPGRTDRSTVQAFAGYRTDDLRWGVQYSNQDRQDDPRAELASAFVVRRFGRQASLIGRVDRLTEPSPSGNNIAYLPFDPSAAATFFIGGVEFDINRRLRITPNVVVTRYDRNDQGVRPTTDVHLRITFFLKLE